MHVYTDPAGDAVAGGPTKHSVPAVAPVCVMFDESAQFGAVREAKSIVVELLKDAPIEVPFVPPPKRRFVKTSATPA